jgi:hypothetical protein
MTDADCFAIGARVSHRNHPDWRGTVANKTFGFMYVVWDHRAELAPLPYMSRWLIGVPGKEDSHGHRMTLDERMVDGMKQSMSTTTRINPPSDWVIVGTRTTYNRVRLFASVKLAHSELVILSSRYNTATLGSQYREYLVTPSTYTLAIVTPDFVIVEADDYATALTKLLGQWSPEVQPQRIEGGGDQDGW